MSGSNAGYTVFRGSVKSTGYPLHSPVSPSLPLPCVTVCHHISTGLCQPCVLQFLRISDGHELPDCRMLYRGAGKSLARPIMFDSENISFDASLVIYINSTNIPPIMIINRIYENQNLLSL
jgi:hypothetical protein